MLSCISPSASVNVISKVIVWLGSRVVVLTDFSVNCGRVVYSSFLQAEIIVRNTAAINTFAFIQELIIPSNVLKTGQPITVATTLLNKIFSTGTTEFGTIVSEVYAFQRLHNPVYHRWCELASPTSGTAALPAFLPISFFKTHRVMAGEEEAETVFESSGTTGQAVSRHFVKDLSVYRRSFDETFRRFYGDPADWCVIGLLPSYLERQQSSLVFMVDELIRRSGHEESGFYLYEHERLAKTLERLETAGQKTLLIGVTFALLDFASEYRLDLRHTVVMETGGMKGRGKEQTREELHALLHSAFGVEAVHAEYGMTELLSQAYSTGKGRFVCPPWMKVMVREEEDPLVIRETGRGILNIIDLANVYSCSFIATDDVGEVYADGSFSVLGRVDASDIRGCSLLVI